MNFREAMDFIGSFPKSGAPIYNLSRITKLLGRLDNPQKKLEFVHIAGTNGKGSTLEMISCGLIDAGLRVGQFTSPYVLRYEDRIRVNGEMIDENSLCKNAEFVRRAADNSGISGEYSQFEISFAIALLYFVDRKCDIVCLEVGIGGLLDATNVIERPLVSVITSISLDHTELLGRNVTEIAKQKGGIIKYGCPAVLSPQNDDEVCNVISSIAELKNAPLTIPDVMGFDVGMKGLHQLYNATTAAAALNILSRKYSISSANITNGIKDARVRARFEQIGAAPITIYDGAHNPDGIERLRATISVYGDFPRRVALLAMQSARVRNARCFCGIFDKIICTDGFPDAEPRERLAERFRNLGESAISVESFAALAAARTVAGADGLVIAGGSLYLYSILGVK